MTELVVGPLLRHVGETDATVWVETDGPCTVEVLGARERTWQVGGHHYALVQVGGLEPGTTTPYDVRLDSRPVWPPADDPRPGPRIRTLGDAGKPLRVAFGSCRYSTSRSVGDRGLDDDALDVLARRLVGLPEGEWPDALLLLGDQVYADETSAEVQERIRHRRDPRVAPGLQVKDFEEYTWLYAESWRDPDVRWLLATLPTSMVFDDHDIADDWNTSALWRRTMQATSWWEDRVVGGLASYWIYQHLGNLGPAELAADDLYQRVRAAAGDCLPMVEDFARAADREADGQKGAQWSYRRDLGRTRLLVIDSRCGRVLDDGPRYMTSEPEFRWIEKQVEGDYDHLLVGTSLPWLLPRALHDVEAWDERVAEGARGRRAAAFAERFRCAADLEHWAAFRASFDRLAHLFGQVGRGEHGSRAPASVCVLSGDVHHAYAARAAYGRDVAPVWQLTCSPLHNAVPRAMKIAFRIAWSRTAEAVMRLAMDRVARVPRHPLTWERKAGPFYGNQIATLTLDGRSARVVFEQSRRTPAGPVLVPVANLDLTTPPPTPPAK